MVWILFCFADLQPLVRLRAVVCLAADLGRSVVSGVYGVLGDWGFSERDGTYGVCFDIIWMLPCQGGEGGRAKSACFP